MLSLLLALVFYWLGTCRLQLCRLHNHLEMTRGKTWQKVKKLTQGIARSFSHRADRDHDFPNQTYTTPELATSRPSWPPIMADGEEDFSSLPLTDRWVHKVRSACPGSQLGTSLPGWAQHAEANTTLALSRSGKFAKEHTRKLRNYSKSAPVNTIQSSRTFSTTPRYGRGLWRTAMWLPSKMA